MKNDLGKFIGQIQFGFILILSDDSHKYHGKVNIDVYLFKP